MQGQLEQFLQHHHITDAIDQHAIVALTDQAGHIIYANDMFCKLSGYSKQELLGQNHRIVNSGHHGPEFFHNLWKTIAAGVTWHGDICNRNKSGELYWVRTTIVPYKDEKGRISRYLSIRTDITETVIIKEKLQKSYEQYKDLNDKLRADQLALRNKNIALNEIISHLDDEKVRVKSEIKQNIETIVMPLINQLKVKKTGLDLKYMDLMETCLADLSKNLLPIEKSFVRVLTPKEIQICSMIKNGLTVKEIAAFFNLSPRTIDKHRENIRSKLGLKSKKINLTTFLLTIDTDG